MEDIFYSHIVELTLSCPEQRARSKRHENLATRAIYECHTALGGQVGGTQRICSNLFTISRRRSITQEDPQERGPEGPDCSRVRVLACPKAFQADGGNVALVQLPVDIQVMAPHKCHRRVW